MKNFCLFKYAPFFVYAFSAEVMYHTHFLHINISTRSKIIKILKLCRSFLFAFNIHNIYVWNLRKKYYRYFLFFFSLIVECANETKRKDTTVQYKYIVAEISSC